MAKYLDTQAISSELMNLIKEAKEKIVLVTYSLKVNTQIQERLKTKSALGNISTHIIFGNTTLQPSELEWMRDIEDLKLFQKKNLHAKCYLNENKAIISSMNLYDYSQANNVEMGILIERKESEENWEKLIDDIFNLEINAEEKIKPNDLFLLLEKETQEKVKDKEIVLSTTNIEYNYQQQLAKKLLEKYRKTKSKELKQNISQILPNEVISKIVLANSSIEIKELLEKADKIKLVKEVFTTLAKCDKYSLGKVVDVKYNKDGLSNDKVCLLTFDDGTKKWYSTKMELPNKNTCVAVKLNEDWFNDYEILTETNLPYKRIKYTESEEKKDKDDDSFCIRCGSSIKFNIEKPMCRKCFGVWNQFADGNYPEKFCHYSGEPSNGETTFAKPILKKNWNKAKEKMDILDLPS